MSATSLDLSQIKTDALSYAPQFRALILPTQTGNIGKYLVTNGTDVFWATGSGGGGSTAWGFITGNLADQSDLQSALNAKASLSGATFTGAASFPSISLSSALGVSSGGTGLATTPTNGQLLIGNGTGYTASTLTAGDGILLTNGAGSISVAAGTVPASRTLTATITNAESFAITRGQVVYAFGAAGDRMSVKLANNNADSTSAKTVGVVSDATIAAGASGTITLFGQVTNLDLSAFAVGDSVYLDSTAGAFTNVKPYAPNHLVYVGTVERANVGNGLLYVRIQNGYELDEIHDVQILSSPSAGAVLIRDATNSLWKAATLTGGTGITITNADASSTIGLNATAVSAGNYGSASAVPTFSVNAQGQLTLVTDVSIAIANTQVSGLGTLSTQNANNVSISGGSISGITDLAIADGGTGASTASTARVNLLPSYTGNATKVLAVNGSATDVEWVTASGGGGGSGTVTSVAMTVPTGFAISGTPITTSGTLALAFDTGYALPTTASQTNWDTAYTDRLKWDGGSTGLVAATGRASLGATTLGANLFTISNPSAITFPRFNADNSVSSLSASAFRTAIGAGTGDGTVTSVTGTSPVSSSGGTTPAISLASAYGDTQNPYGSKTANYVLAAPAGTAGAPTFRALVSGDIPTLNQNTTGSAGSVANSATFNNSGSGAASGATFNGSSAVTISHNTVGASPLAGSSSITTVGTITSGTWQGTAIGNTYLANSSLTIGTTSISLGGTSLTLGGLTSVAVTQDPTSALQLATKQYVDAVTQGLHIHASCAVATTGTLASITGGTVTYNNGSSGVGATLTLSVALTALDGYTLQNGDRVLVKNEATSANNGIYIWATGGTVLTRATDFDSSAEIDSGDFTFVSNGSLYAGTGWVQTNVVATVGTTSVLFTQFAGPGTYTAGTGLTLTGTQFSLTVPVSIANGGTGQTTQQGAINALAGATTSAQYLRGNGTNVVMSAIQAGDVPTLNQSTSGSAASLSISGQTGLLTFAGLTSVNRIKTVRDAADTILELGGSYTPSGTWNWATASVTWPTFNQNTTGTASNVTGTVAIGNGGTGQTTATAAINALLPSQSTNSGKYLTTDGTNTSWATVSASAAWGSITGTLSSQTDLQNALNAKASLSGATFTGAVALSVGTVTSNVGLSLAGVWNNASTVFEPFTIDFVDTASNALSLFSQYSSNGIVKHEITKAGYQYIYQNWTASDSYEQGRLAWVSNNFVVGTTKGSIGGSARALELQTDATTRLVISTTGLIQLAGTTASFPAIKRNSTAINFRLADDSADAPITAGQTTLSASLDLTMRTVTYSSTTMAIDAALGNKIEITLANTTGTISNPTNAVNGRILIFRLRQDGTGSKTVIWDTQYQFSGDLASVTLSTTANAVDRIAFEYDSTLTKWVCISFIKGT